jgi:hypothetical protein
MATIKKAQAGKKVVKKPTYKNLRMGVANASKVEGKDYTEKATKQDSISYNRGFARGLKKDKETRWDLDEVEKMGRWEGLNTKKSGGPVKKAKSGTSLGMKSVKAGYDKNPGVTRADFVSIGKGTAKSGAALKKQAATAIAMKKAGKAPKATMKSGGKMTKCKYGCK